MFAKYALPLIAVLGIVFAIKTVVDARQVPPVSQPLREPSPRPASKEALSGTGLIEANMENIPIGTNVPGVVVDVYVKIGNSVKKGDPLFRVDDRDLKAELRVKEAALASAKAQYHKLESAPRPEDVPPLQAAVDEAHARLESAKFNAERTRSLFGKGMATNQDFDTDRFNQLAADATYKKAKADLDRLKAGTWKEDLDVARAAVDQAESEVDSVKVNLDRLTVRALTDGQVLQVNVRPGQFAALAWKEPLIVLGDVNTLNVRVDIDENDLAFFEPGRHAFARLRGRPEVEFQLAYVKTEPYVIPKRNLIGDNSERVDTRVLQVIYAIKKSPIKVYVGQQMDVSIVIAETEKKEKSKEVAAVR